MLPNERRRSSLWMFLELREVFIFFPKELVLDRIELFRPVFLLSFEQIFFFAVFNLCFLLASLTSFDSVFLVDKISVEVLVFLLFETVLFWDVFSFLIGLFIDFRFRYSKEL